MNYYKNHTSTRNLNYKFKVISALKYMYVFSFHIIKDFTGTCNMHGFFVADFINNFEYKECFDLHRFTCTTLKQQI